VINPLPWPRSAATRLDLSELVNADQLAANEDGQLLTVKFRQPSHEFTFGVGMTFLSYPLVLTPMV
jgi:hypothetical protein